MQKKSYQFRSKAISSDVKKYNSLIMKLTSAFISSFLCYITISALQRHCDINGTCSSNASHLHRPHPENGKEYPPILKSPNLEDDCNVFLFVQPMKQGVKNDHCLKLISFHQIHFHHKLMRSLCERIQEQDLAI